MTHDRRVVPRGEPLASGPRPSVTALHLLASSLYVDAAVQNQTLASRGNVKKQDLVPWPGVEEVSRSLD
jgi:hypothetical protein